MSRINYITDNCTIEADPEKAILHNSLDNDIPHMHVCGGNARCSTCRVLILDGLEHLTPRNDKEKRIADKLMFAEHVRLACQTKVPNGEITLRRLVIDREDAMLAESQAVDEAGRHRLGVEKTIAILFSDIRGFTTYSEKLPPYDVFHVLNRYFHEMDMVIAKYQGQTVNYMGDGLMALFGVDDDENPAMNAVRAGLEMLESVTKFNEYIQEIHQDSFRIGIGMHCGEAIVGTLGSHGNQRLTAIGDAVNFASRIESMNKEMGTSFLISEDAYERVKDQVTMVRACDLVQVKGKSGDYQLYEVTGIR